MPSNGLLRFSKRVKVTENGYSIELGQGLFRTAKKILFKQYIIDPSNGQAAVYSVLLKAVLPANVMIRLKVKKQVATEIETIIARNGEASIAAPKNLTTPKPIEDLPTSMFKPRSIFVSELFKIVNGQILEIEAVMVNAPFGATSGWEAKDTCRN